MRHEVMDPAIFLGVVNEMLARSTGGRSRTAKAASFAALARKEPTATIARKTIDTPAGAGGWTRDFRRS